MKAQKKKRIEKKGREKQVCSQNMKKKSNGGDGEERRWRNNGVSISATVVHNNSPERNEFHPRQSYCSHYT